MTAALCCYRFNKMQLPIFTHHLFYRSGMTEQRGTSLYLYKALDMQRIRTVLQKLTELAQRNPDRTLIDVDLMLDYTRVIYADLLELRGGMNYKPQLNINEPTLDELSTSMSAAPEVTDIIEEPAPPAPPPAPVVIKEAEQTPVAPTPTPADIPAPVQPNPAMTIEPPKPLAPLPPLPPTAKPAKDIRRFIDLNEKYLFLSELFNNDLRAYEETMNELSACADKQQAQQLLGAKFQDESNSAYDSFQQLLDRFFE